MDAKTVLVVEDDFLLAMSLELTLAENGWKVLGPVSTVAEALTLLSQSRPAVALLDVNLGRESVAPVAMALREHGVPFALASAYDYPEQYGGAVLIGAPNVGKPTNDRRLLHTLSRLIAP